MKRTPKRKNPEQVRQLLRDADTLLKEHRARMLDMTPDEHNAGIERIQKMLSAALEKQGSHK
jgi:hypothetical protein